MTGPVAAGYRRAFWSRGEVFEMRLPTRGYYRELEPPLPVEVLEGRIKGTLHQTDRRLRPEAGRHIRVAPPPDGDGHARRPGWRGLAMTAARHRRCSPLWSWRRSAARRRGGGTFGAEPRARAGAARPAASPAPAAAPVYDDLDPAASDDRARRRHRDDQAARRCAAPGARVLGPEGSRHRAAARSSARAAAGRSI